MEDLNSDARAVLLPVAGGLELEPWLTDLLTGGTVAVLVAETRSEYVAREMSPERRRDETRREIVAFAEQVRERVSGPAVVALDQEPWGIQRLHDLVPQFPAPAELSSMSDDDIIEAAGSVGRAARDLGVTMFLSPVLDVLTGENPWLQGRTLDLDHAEVGRIGSAFVRGVQSAGIVAVAKHFPGYPLLASDPALDRTKVGSGASTEADLEPFRRVVRDGVAGIMTGPAIVEAIDPHQPASTSRPTIELLRDDLGFAGLVVSDDLDAPSTTLGRSLEETAIASLLAGADLLLVPGGPHLVEMARTIEQRAATDELLSARLSDAARAVRAVAVGGAIT